MLMTRNKNKLVECFHCVHCLPKSLVSLCLKDDKIISKITTKQSIKSARLVRIIAVMIKSPQWFVFSWCTYCSMTLRRCGHLRLVFFLFSSIFVLLLNYRIFRLEKYLIIKGKNVYIHQSKFHKIQFNWIIIYLWTNCHKIRYFAKKKLNYYISFPLVSMIAFIKQLRAK